MRIERDIIRLKWVIEIDKEEFDKAFTNQNEYNALIMNISNLIYEQGKGRIV